MGWYFFTGVWWFDTLGAAFVAGVGSVSGFLAGGQYVVVGATLSVVTVALLGAGVWGGRAAGWTFRGARNWMTGKPFPEALLAPANRIFSLRARIGLTVAGLSLFLLFLDVVLTECTASGPCQPTPPLPVAIPFFLLVVGLVLFLVGTWRPPSAFRGRRVS